MRRVTLLVIIAVFGILALAGSAQAIVHGATPIICAGAVAASGGAAEGFAAVPVLTDPSNPAPNPPMPGQGLANAGGSVC